MRGRLAAAIAGRSPRAIASRALGRMLLHALGATAALGQSRDSLPPPRDSVQRLPPRSITATVVPSGGVQVGARIPARITVLGPSARPGGAGLLPDVIAGATGVSTYDDLGATSKRTIMLQGFTVSPVVGLPQGLSVFIDGVRVNEPEAAQVNFDLLPTDHVERTELLTGIGTLLGRNALGGAVNLVTARGTRGAQASLDASAGSFGARQLTARLGGARGPWDGYVGSGRHKERGWRQDMRSDRSHLFAQVGRTSARHGVRVMAFGADADAYTAGSLPERLYRSRPDSNLSPGDVERLRQWHLAASAWRTMGSAGATRVDATVAARQHRAERFNRNQPLDPDVYARSRNRTLSAALDLTHVGRIGGRAIGGRLGVEGALTGVQIALYRDREKFNATRELTTDVRSAGVDLAAWGVGDITFGRATVAGGVRFDHVRSPYRNRLDSDRDTVNRFTHVGARAGLAIRTGRAGTLHGSFAQAFRAPVTLELACADPEQPCPLPFALGDDPPLAPVLVEQWELGARWPGRRVTWSLAWFLSAVRNDIALLPAPGERPGSTLDGYFANLARTRRQGADAEVRMRLTGAWSAYANWTWTRATYEVTERLFSIRAAREEAEGEPISEGTQVNTVRPGDRLPLIPEHLVKAGVSHVRGRWSMTTDARYVGRRWARGDEANETAPLAGYAMVDVRLEWHADRYAVSLAVENAFDARAAVFGGYNIDQGAPGGPTLERFLMPSTPRRVQFGMRWQLAGASPP